jgi:hypothetical protein
MNATEEINDWIKKYGSERDALNVAILKIHLLEKRNDILTDLLSHESVTDQKEWDDLMNLCRSIYHSEYPISMHEANQLKKLLEFFGEGV